MLKLLVATLLMLPIGAHAQTSCSLTTGPLVLEKPRVGITPLNAAFLCMNRNIDLLSYSTSPVFGAPTSTGSAYLLHVGTIAAGAAYNVTVSSPLYVKEWFQIGGGTFVVRNGTMTVGGGAVFNGPLIVSGSSATFVNGIGGLSHLGGLGLIGTVTSPSSGTFQAGLGGIAALGGLGFIGTSTHESSGTFKSGVGGVAGVGGLQLIGTVTQYSSATFKGTIGAGPSGELEVVDDMKVNGDFSVLDDMTVTGGTLTVVDAFNGGIIGIRGDAGLSAVIQLGANNLAVGGVIGEAGTTGGLIVGSAANDIAILSRSGKDILFSADGGTSIDMSLSDTKGLNVYEQLTVSGASATFTTGIGGSAVAGGLSFPGTTTNQSSATFKAGIEGNAASGGLGITGTITQHGTSSTTLGGALGVAGMIRGPGASAAACGQADICTATDPFWHAASNKPAYMMQSGGSGNYGQISNVSAETWGLGAGPQSAIGTVLLRWSLVGGVVISTQVTVTSSMTVTGGLGGLAHLGGLEVIGTSTQRSSATFTAGIGGLTALGGLQIGGLTSYSSATFTSGIGGLTALGGLGITGTITQHGTSSATFGGAVQAAGMVRGGGTTAAACGTADFCSANSPFFHGGSNVPGYMLQSGGSGNYGQISNVSAETWGLGAGPQTSLGTTLLRWSLVGGVHISTQVTISGSSMTVTGGIGGLSHLGGLGIAGTLTGESSATIKGALEVSGSTFTVATTGMVSAPKQAGVSACVLAAAGMRPDGGDSYIFFSTATSNAALFNNQNMIDIAVASDTFRTRTTGSEVGTFMAGGCVRIAATAITSLTMQVLGLDAGINLSHIDHGNIGTVTKTFCFHPVVFTATNSQRVQFALNATGTSATYGADGCSWNKVYFVRLN